MKKKAGLVTLLTLCVVLGFTGTALAQKQHAPKGVWKAMLASLGDIQNITSALAVLDMKRASEVADQLVKRETFISKLERLPKPVRDGHGKVAVAARELAAAAAAGDEQEMSKQIGSVLAACSACHYDIRDKKRREKMK